jgi:hypothetical protein
VQQARKVVLDSGGVTRLAERSRQAAALLGELRRSNLWPPLIPSAVLVECLTGHGSRDAAVNRLVNACEVVEYLSTALARRAAALRTSARRGSAVDALVVALAEPAGAVLTGDAEDLVPLAAAASDVRVRIV